MDLVNVHRLRVFLEVADRLSFSQAARSLGISQPSVSIHIKELEKLLGTPLFDHRMRGVELTDAGKRLCRYATTILDAVEDAGVALLAEAEVLSGHLAIVATSVWEHSLSVLLVDYLLQNRNVTATVSIARPREIREALVSGKAHLGFVAQEPRDADLEVSRIFEYEAGIVVMMAPGHPLTKLKSVELGQLEQFPFVSYPIRNEPKHLDYLSRMGFRAKHVLEIESLEAVLRAIELGLAISIGEELATVSDPKSAQMWALTTTKRIVARHLEVPPLKTSYLAIRSKRRGVSALERHLMDYVTTNFEKTLRGELS